VGLEALARWKHPEHGWVPPSEFIPLTERMGLIKALTSCVLDLVLSRCRGWQNAGIAVPIAVNLSMRNLLDPGFASSVAECLKATGVDPGLLKLEITETAVMAEPGRAMETMTRLCQLGIGFAVDDFGTGYSSLAYLQRLPVEQIKIDRSFVGQMVTDPGSASIVRATIDLGHSLGLEVVAEGIEDMPTYQMLTAYACETAQGYLICRPLPGEQVEEWLHDPIWRPDTHREISAA
jgi:EAL domain-containing protein (putative c-di-GMP-specific phosphodiesterase class I)